MRLNLSDFKQKFDVTRLYIFYAVYATGQQQEEDGKSLVRDERENAITCVFCRDLQ